MSFFICAYVSQFYICFVNKPLFPTTFAVNGGRKIKLDKTLVSPEMLTGSVFYENPTFCLNIFSGERTV